MRTYKSCAASHDNPDYLIRNKFTLLQKDGNKFFSSGNRYQYKLPVDKPIRTIYKEVKLGLSRDSPYITRLSYVHPSTTSLLKGFTPRDRGSIQKLSQIQSHTLLQECERKSKGDSYCFNKLMRSNTPMKRPHNMFTLMLRRASSKEVMIKQSLLDPYNIRALQASVLREKDSPYKQKLLAFTAKLRKQASAKIRYKSCNRTSNKSFMTTEQESKNSLVYYS